jgi:hypothetical protein
MLGELCLNDVVDSLGLPRQNQNDTTGMYSLLLRQDITGIPELEQFIIDLVDVPPYIKPIIADPSKAELRHAQQIVQCPEWSGEIGSN